MGFLIFLEKHEKCFKSILIITSNCSWLNFLKKDKVILKEMVFYHFIFSVYPGLRHDTLVT